MRVCVLHIVSHMILRFDRLASVLKLYEYFIELNNIIYILYTVDIILALFIICVCGGTSHLCCALCTSINYRMFLGLQRVPLFFMGLYILVYLVLKVRRVFVLRNKLLYYCI